MIYYIIIYSYADGSGTSGVIRGRATMRFFSPSPTFFTLIQMTSHDRFQGHVSSVQDGANKAPERDKALQSHGAVEGPQAIKPLQMRLC